MAVALDKQPRPVRAVTAIGTREKTIPPVWSRDVRLSRIYSRDRESGFFESQPRETKKSSMRRTVSV